MKFFDEVRTLYKSNDTEDFFDKKINNPLGFIFTKLFIKLRWSPNQITFFAMIIGVAGGTLFYWQDIKINLFGILLIFISVILDATDGQVARLTNQKSKLGRFLDGIESGVVFTAINIAFSFRLYSQEIPFLGGLKWGIWIFVLAAFSEARGMQRQCMMADYYRNIHVYYLNGNSELDRSEDLALQPKSSSLFEKVYQSIYMAYTKRQEKATPAFQWFYTQTNKLFGGPTQEIKDAFVPQSKKLMPLANAITLNTRIIAVFACVILGKIEYFYVFELIVLGFLLRILVGKYEKIFSTLSNSFLPPENQYKKRNNFQVICFLIGVVGIAVMLAETDLSSIEWDSLLDRLPYGIAIIAVIWVVNYLLFALAYKLIIGRSVKGFTLWHNYLITLSSFALNNVTPVGFMGGEPYRIMKMKRHLGIEEATSSTISFTIMTTAAHFAFWVCGCTLFFVLFGFSKSVFLSVVMALALLFCLAVVLSFLFSNKGKFSYGILSFFSKWPLIGKLFRKILANNADKIATIDSNIHQFQQHKLRFWAVFVLTFIVRVFEGFELYVLLRVLGLDEILLIQALFTMAMTSLVGNILFIIPMQLGAREGGAALALRWLGFEGSLGMTATLLARLREIFFTLLGVLIIQLNNKKEDE